MSNAAPARVPNMPNFFSSMGHRHQGSRLRLVADLNDVALKIGYLE